MAFSALSWMCIFMFLTCFARGDHSLPIMELYDFVNDHNNIICYSDCSGGLMNDVDLFTMRGKVNKNGSSSVAFTDTNLYLQAVRDPNTNDWAPQCKFNLTVCGSGLTTDCYCERKDPNGDYHLVMNIMVKSIYSGGKLMLSWNDARSLYNPPVISNIVNYYPGAIRSQGTDRLPIMQLYEFVDDPQNIVCNSGCSGGLMNEVDLFTMRGKVNKNGSSSVAFTDTNLYLQAGRDPNTNAWASQCKFNLMVCGSSLTTDCYCERKDPNGDYHLVMNIMVKSIYSGGKLMLSWMDARSPSNPPVVSNIVNYYPGAIRSQGTDRLPIMQLYEFVDDPQNIVCNSGCSGGLMNEVDLFTMRGKVNKNGSSSVAFTDTNLYLQAVRDPNTNAWASQCLFNLMVCGSGLTTDCYCERKDPNGDYHLVMNIMVKSIYSGGKLMLSWNDARSPYNPPVISNIVNYYPGAIRSQGTDRLPIMQLYEFVDDPQNIVCNSGCSGGLMNEVDLFTMRGKVNKNGSSSVAFTDTNLYLQAVRDPNTNAWAPQCKVNLMVCGSGLTTDCYCERKDTNGDYHLVMNIMVKSIYSGGKLMLSWMDARSPSNPPVISNIVNYYPGAIRLYDVSGSGHEVYGMALIVICCMVTIFGLLA